MNEELEEKIANYVMLVAVVAFVAGWMKFSFETFPIIVIATVLTSAFVALFMDYAVFRGVGEWEIGRQKKVNFIGSLAIIAIAATVAVLIAPAGWWPINIAYFLFLALISCFIGGMLLMKEKENSNPLPEI